MIHDAPGAPAAEWFEIGGVDHWCRVALFGDTGLKRGLPCGELGVGRESEHDTCREIVPRPWGEGKGPHLRPEPAAESDRRSVEDEFGSVELSTKMVEDRVEFGGVFDGVGFIGNTHSNDRNGKYRQRPVIY